MSWFAIIKCVVLVYALLQGKHDNVIKTAIYYNFDMHGYSNELGLTQIEC